MLVLEKKPTGFLNFLQTRVIWFLTLFSMTWRRVTRHRRTVVITALAVAASSIVPAGSAFADERADAPAAEPLAAAVVDEPAPAGDPAPEPVEKPATEPETGEVDGAVVAVGLPPVPPATDEPQVAVGLPPVPPATDEPQVAVGKPPVPPTSRQAAPVETPVAPIAPAGLADTVDAALDLIDDCL